ENPYRLISHWVKDTEPHQGIRHEVQRQLDLVDSIGCRPTDKTLSFKTREQDRLSMLGRLASCGVPGKNGWIVVHCGASAPSRRYSLGQFASVVAKLR